MKNPTISAALATLALLLLAAPKLKAQWDDDVHRVRLGVRTLLPNIAGLHAEYALPAVGNRLSVAADFSHISIGSSAGDLSSDFGVGIRYNYFALGCNFYLGGSGRAKGPYIGAHFQRLVGRTHARIDADNYEKGKASINGMAFVFGIQTGGHFLFGFEMGAGRPFGNFRGSVVKEENGIYFKEAYSEPFFLPFIRGTTSCAGATSPTPNPSFCHLYPCSTSAQASLFETKIPPPPPIRQDVKSRSHHETHPPCPRGTSIGTPAALASAAVPCQHNGQQRNLAL